LKEYRFLEHTTDVLIEAYGENLDEVFSNAAKALVDTMIDIDKVNGGSSVEFELKGSDLENLLYNWLEEVLLKVEIDEMVFSSFDLKITESNGKYRLRGIGKGESLDLKKHKPKTEVKAPTYHRMHIRKEKGKFRAQFLLDI
jgi:SHS2 domain-containing protein